MPGDRLTDAYESFTWWADGQIATIVVERYDDTADAVLWPLLLGVVMVVSYTAVGAALGSGTTTSLGISIVGSFISVHAAFQMVLHLGASWVYATQVTELESKRWWIDG